LLVKERLHLFILGIHKDIITGAKHV